MYYFYPCRSEFLDQELVQPAMPFRAVLDKAQVARFSSRVLRTVMRVLLIGFHKDQVLGRTVSGFRFGPSVVAPLSNP